jgi:hypothetical protein
VDAVFGTVGAGGSVVAGAIVGGAFGSIPGVIFGGVVGLFYNFLADGWNIFGGKSLKEWVKEKLYKELSIE